MLVIAVIWHQNIMFEFLIIYIYYIFVNISNFQPVKK